MEFVHNVTMTAYRPARRVGEGTITSSLAMYTRGIPVVVNFFFENMTEALACDAAMADAGVPPTDQPLVGVVCDSWHRARNVKVEDRHNGLCVMAAEGGTGRTFRLNFFTNPE